MRARCVQDACKMHISDHLHMFVSKCLRHLVPVLAAVQTWSSACTRTSFKSRSIQNMARWMNSDWNKRIENPHVSQCKSCDLVREWYMIHIWFIYDSYRMIIQIEWAKCDTLIAFVEVCTRYAWHRSRFPRPWLTGQVRKLHFAEETVQGILHRSQRSNRRG